MIIYQARDIRKEQEQNLCIAAQSWTKLNIVEQSRAKLSKLNIDDNFVKKSFKKVAKCWEKI